MVVDHIILSRIDYSTDIFNCMSTYSDVDLEFDTNSRRQDHVICARNYTFILGLTCNLHMKLQTWFL
jgi:hypothetical protein